MSGSFEHPGGQRVGIGGSGFVAVVVIAGMVFAALFHAPVLLRTPSNADELIYLSLADRLAKGEPYSLQGTAILGRLPGSMYDHAIFNHPPGFGLLLRPWAGAPAQAGWISLLALVVTVGAVGIAAAAWLPGELDLPLRRVLFVLPVAACATDPILSFCARRVWPDAATAAAVAVSLAGTAWFWRRGGWKALGVAAMGAAAAVTLKLPAMVLIVPLAGLIFFRGRNWRDVGLFLLPAVLVVVAWEAVFFARTGALWPHWLRIGEDLLSTNPFVAQRVAQPPTFFPLALVTLVPLSGLVVVAAVRPALRGGPIAVLLGCVVLFVGVLMLLGGVGVSKEARYLAPVMPLLLVLLALLLAEAARSFSWIWQLFIVLCVMAILSGAATAGFHLVALQSDEPVHPWTVIDGASR